MPRLPRSTAFVIDAVEEFLATKAAREYKTLMAYSSLLRARARSTCVSLAPYLAGHLQKP